MFKQLTFLNVFSSVFHSKNIEIIVMCGYISGKLWRVFNSGVLFIYLKLTHSGTSVVPALNEC